MVGILFMPQHPHGDSTSPDLLLALWRYTDPALRIFIQTITVHRFKLGNVCVTANRNWLTLPQQMGGILTRKHVVCVHSHMGLWKWEQLLTPSTRFDNLTASVDLESSILPTWATLGLLQLYTSASIMRIVLISSPSLPCLPWYYYKGTVFIPRPQKYFCQLDNHMKSCLPWILEASVSSHLHPLFFFNCLNTAVKE